MAKRLEPNQWKVEKVADIGASEEFVQQLLELHAIVDAGTIREPRRQQVKEAIAVILVDGLMPAFLELKEIRASVTQTMPLMNRQQLYEDFARKLWKAYKAGSPPILRRTFLWASGSAGGSCSYLRSSHTDRAVRHLVALLLHSLFPLESFMMRPGVAFDDGS